MDEFAALKERLQALETRQRRMRFWCVASSALWIVSCLAAVAAPWHDELRVKRLVLVDERGAECGTLATDADGASLMLKSRDEKATVRLLASTATFTEQHVSSSFTISEDGAVTEPEPEETQYKGPWSGLIAWTGDEKEPGVVTTMSASDLDAFSTARGERRIGLSTSDPNGLASLHIEGEGDSEALLAVDEHDAVLYMQGGDDPYGALNLGAGAEGCRMGGSWNDGHSFDLVATKEDASLSLSQTDADEDEDTDSPQEVELHATGNHGTLELRDKSGVTFQAPK